MRNNDTDKGKRIQLIDEKGPSIYFQKVPEALLMDITKMTIKINISEL